MDLDNPIVFWWITGLMLLGCIIYSFFIDKVTR